MTSLYSYCFESSDGTINVHFVDVDQSIDSAEALAQIGHYFRRRWATRMIREMITSDVSEYHYFPGEFFEKCPFEDRLMAENWIEPFVTLVVTATQRTLHVYRLYIFILLFRK